MRATAYVLSTAAQQVLAPGHVGAILQADSGNAVDVYIGPAYVTADAASTGGFRLAAGQSLPIVIAGDDYVWAVAPSGAPVLRVLTGEPEGRTLIDAI